MWQPVSDINLGGGAYGRRDEDWASPCSSCRHAGDKNGSESNMSQWACHML